MLLLNKADVSHLDANGHRCSVYWLYWYKSTNTDADVSLLDANGRKCSVCWLYWYKSTNTDSDVSLLGANGRSALWFAENHGHEEVVKALVQAGAA